MLCVTFIFVSYSAMIKALIDNEMFTMSKDIVKTTIEIDFSEALINYRKKSGNAGNSACGSILQFIKSKIMPKKKSTGLKF